MSGARGSTSWKARRILPLLAMAAWLTACVLAPKPAPPCPSLNVSTSVAVSAPPPLRPMGDHYGPRTCGSVTMQPTGGYEAARLFRGCALNAGCYYSQDPLPEMQLCPEGVPVHTVEEFVRNPSLQRKGERVVVTGRLNLVNFRSWARLSAQGCAQIFYFTALEASVEGACYAVELHPGVAGLRCTGDASLACCGELPMGAEVHVVGTPVTSGPADPLSQAPFDMYLRDLRFCLLPGESPPKAIPLPTPVGPWLGRPGPSGAPP